jgi:putative transcriptional regulator
MTVSDKESRANAGPPANDSTAKDVSGSSRKHDYEQRFADGLLAVLERQKGVSRPDIPKVNPKEIREALGISQQDFSSRFAIPLATLRNWEQGRTEPDAPTSLLLYLISKFPKKIAAEVKKMRGK